MPPYLYSLCLTSPARVVQIDLQTNQVVTSISLSGNQAHIGGKSEDGQYVYIGTLEAPNAIIKVKVPEMTEVLSVSIPDVPLGNIIEQNGRLYVGTTNGRIYEYDALTLQQIRVLQLSTAPNVNVTGFIFYNGFIFACLGEVAGQAFNFFLVRIDPATLTEIDRVQIPVAQGVDVGFRVPLEVNGLIYCLVAGWPTPTRIVTVNPTNMAVLRFDDFPSSTAPDRLAYDGQYLYWNQDVRPSKLSRMDPVTYELSVITMPTAGETRASDADIYQRTLYLNNMGTPPDNTSLGNLSIINLDTFTRTGVIDLGAGNDFPIQSIVVAEEAPPPPTGVLSIDTEPMKAEVIVDGQPWGTAPQSRTLDVGNYTVSFGSVSGYNTPVDQLIQVLEDLTTPVLGTYIETQPPPPGLPAGRHIGWWETHLEGQGYTPKEFFDTYFLTPPYPSFLEVLLTDRNKWNTSSLVSWYDQLLTFADAYPNIEIALMIGASLTETGMDDPNHPIWADFEDFIVQLKDHPSAFSFGIMWEYFEPDSWTTAMNAFNITESQGVRFVSYRSGYEFMAGNQQIDGVWDIHHTNFPALGSEYATLDRGQGFFHIGQSAGFWATNQEFPSTAPCPTDRGEKGDFGWQECTVNLIIEKAVEKDDKLRHAVTFVSAFTSTPFTGVSGKTTTRLWDNPLFRQLIWNSPDYQGNFVLSTGIQPIPKGTLSVNTEPVPGEVFVNGVSWGQSPQSKTVDVGPYTVSFGAVSEYNAPKPITAVVNEGQVTTVTGTYTGGPIATGRLSIDTEPVKGPVFVDGELWGTAPQNRILSVGTYPVSYGSVEGYDPPGDRTVRVMENLTTSVLGKYIKVTPTPPVPPIMLLGALTPFTVLGSIIVYDVILNL